MGGNASLGYTLINQRAEEVNKAVLEICDCLILHRQKGKNSLTSLGRWLDFSNPALSKEIIQTLPTLEAGQCWIWPQGDSTPVLCRFPHKNTFHPDRKHPDKIRASKPVDVGSFVTQLSQSLGKSLAEAKENDPAELKRRIRELEKHASQKEAQVKTVEVPVLSESDLEAMGAVSGSVERYIQELQKAAATLQESLAVLKGTMGVRSAVRHAIKTAVRTPVAQQTQATVRTERQQQGAGDSLGRCEKSILNALAQYPQGRTKAQIAILTGYSGDSGSFNNALGSLRSHEFITRGGDPKITEAGMDALGPFEPLPSGSALVELWLGKLGKCERSILDCLVQAYPNSITKDELGQQTGYSGDSGSFNNALGRLRTLELITRGQPVKASDHLFQ